MGLLIIKLGGSVITREGSDGLFHQENVRRIAGELLPYANRCILVHGTGLVGKRPAVQHKYYHTGRIPAEGAELAAKIRCDLRELNRRFVAELLEAGLNALSMDTSEYFNPAGDALRQDQLGDRITLAVSQGSTPVFFGDLLPQPDGSFQVMSSDTITAILARRLKPQATCLFTDVDGVFARSENAQESGHTVIGTLTESNVDEMLHSDSDKKDVSGGMGEKVAQALEMARYSESCTIANGLVPGILAGVLAGEPVVCTRIVAN